MVTRLNSQKGLDLVERVLAEIMSTGAQMVVLGMGESKYEDLFNWAQWKYAGQLSATFQMNHELSHRIYAGAGHVPHALHVRALRPVAAHLPALRHAAHRPRGTGGLRDTVLSYNEYTGEGNGFSFLNYNAHDMLHVIERAVSIYHEKKAVWNMLARRAMQGSYGWDESAKKYLALYEELTAPKPEKPARKKAAKAEEGEKKPARKKVAKAEEGEKKPASRRKAAAKAGEAPAEGAEKKPARRAAKPKAEDGEAEKKPARRTRARKAEPEA